MRVQLRALQSAAAVVLTDRRILWPIVVLVGAARVAAESTVWWPVGADASQYLDGGRQALSNPSTIYPEAAALIAKGFTWTVTWPPPQILISIPYSLLPPQVGVWAWVSTDAVLVVVSLVLLFRAIGNSRVWAMPAFLVVCLCFTPLFEEVRLGQRSGLLILSAVVAMLTVESRPRLAGALAGLGTSLKFYPAALLLAVAPRRLPKFASSLIVVFALLFLVSFLPFGNPLQYITAVLIPVAAGDPAATHDCFQNSTPLLFSRLLGGQSFSIVNASGVWRDVTLGGLNLPWLATLLAFVTRALLLTGAAWAGWRSGWIQPLSMSMAFSLGALVPGDVYTYQFICLLPLAAVLVVDGIEKHAWLSLAVVAICLWLFISSPCALAFPSLWTVAGLALFVTGLATARRQGVRGYHALQDEADRHPR